MQTRFATALVLALASPAAAQILVPGDFPDLAAAVAAAPPGATIVVATAAQQPPIAIDKPLTILGDPLAHIGTRGAFGCSGLGTPAVTLSGPGAGVVVLAQVELIEPGDCSIRPLVDGGGFDELHLIDAVVVAPPVGSTGTALGAPAIRTSVPLVVVSRSTVEGGEDCSDFCFPSAIAHAGIEAPASRVVVLDSSVRGGSVSSTAFCCFGCTCPLDLSGVGGTGGDGVVAAEVYAAGSTIAGGAGATFNAFDGLPFQSNSTICGVQVDGQAVVTSLLALLPGVVTDSGPIRLGSTWTLSYATPGPLAFLLFGFGLDPPLPVGALGFAFLAPSSAGVLGPIASGAPASIAFAVPTDPALLGLAVAFQIVESTSGLSRPAGGVLVP